MHLCHPGETHTEHTICQHFKWDRLIKTVQNICASCPTCQITKTKTVKYSKFLAKKAEETPWDMLCINLIKPYKILNNNNEMILWALTIIDPTTCWFDMMSIETKCADITANKLETTW